MFRTGKRIGDSLVERGILTHEQVEQILLHCEATGMNFTDAGTELGILRSERATTAKQNSVDFFHLRAEYFPESTRELIPREAILRHGALALGVKNALRLFRSSKVVNVGFLDPSRKDSVAEIEQLVKIRVGSGFGGIRPYLVLPDQFMQVLQSAYGLSVSEIRGLGPAVLEPVLWAYVEETQGAPPLGAN